MTDAPRTGEDLLAAARSWAAEDPDPATRAELEELTDRAGDGDAAARAELADRFAGTLAFGTAGLRAALGAGPMRMNRVVVLRAAAGLAGHVLARTRGSGAGPERPPRAVVGYDARHNSAVFARDTAAVLTAAGIETLLLPAPLPTPVLAWAVRAHDAEAGVMVTASHNPPADNGYKVYLGGRAVEPAARGCQIVAPHDREIAARIDAVGPVASIPRAERGWTVLPAGTARRYLDAVLPAVAPAAPGAPRGLRIVHTALHGVGGTTTTEALHRAGFPDVHPVAAQAEPDPDFPTVAFPNPEEPGALDLALAEARRVGADLVLANDPDADRVAVAVPVRPAGPDAPAEVAAPPGPGAAGTPAPATSPGATGAGGAAGGPDRAGDAAASGSPGGAWRVLRGDEVGALLGAAAARAAAGRGEDAVLACSIVSSRLLGRIAAAAGLGHRETLTGFKWIARVPGLVYGYEEALGYCVSPEVVRDKDGIGAAVAVAVLADELRGQGRVLQDVLDDLALAHGLHATDQLSVRVADLARIPAMLAALREHPPAALAGSAVARTEDLTDPATGLPPTEGLRLLTEDGTRVVVRPSGTEPKLKCYLEVVLPVDDRAQLPAARIAATRRLAAVRAELGTALGL
ncbi:phosphomannomutase [Kocuria flava]|uniref:Phosphomannomutase n=1 Tax=Kocuria flava TaxID=446860 RepID=A0A2N4T4L0_9MICC|nr:phospho-sugar mutase [Kocuria flava]PLC13168.1 phosphomannomutase [Kocuria flava]